MLSLTFLTKKQSEPITFYDETPDVSLLANHGF